MAAQEAEGWNSTMCNYFRLNVYSSAKTQVSVQASWIGAAANRATKAAWVVDNKNRRERAEVQTFGLFSQLWIILIDLRAVPGVVAFEKESTKPGRSSCAVELKLDS
jgi:hypothetical protein